MANAGHHAPGARDRLRAFASAEDGSFVIFGVFLLAIMFVVGGVGIDILRHDAQRLRMQSTLDQAILAAANLDQDLDPEAVVRDYFAKAGMLDRLGSVEVIERINSRQVSAAASMEVDTMFLKAVGIDRLAAAARGTAREEIRDIEVSMVLDISGSMARNNRMPYLRNAAKDFVSSVLADRAGRKGGEVSISLVPYQTEVAIGAEMLSQFTLTGEHSYSTCVQFRPGDFRSTAIDFSVSRQQAGHFLPGDLYNSPPHVDQRGFADIAVPCRTGDSGEITYLSQDEAALHRKIDALEPGSDTSIDVGLKWGAALLDPSLRPAITALVNRGRIDSDFLGRPFDFGRERLMKILVVMTDGENVRQPQIKPQYAGDAPSDVWAHRTDERAYYGDDGIRFSVGDPEWSDYDGDGIPNEPYFIPRLTRWGSDTGSWSGAPEGGDGARQLSWAELWSTTQMAWHAEYLRNAQYPSYNQFRQWAREPVEIVDVGTKNARMSEMCRLAREAGIIVFSIAMDVSERNATRMKDCASSQNHYFNITGQQIDYAFAAIANTINQLRLVQ